MHRFLFAVLYGLCGCKKHEKEKLRLNELNEIASRKWEMRMLRSLRGFLDLCALRPVRECCLSFRFTFCLCFDFYFGVLSPSLRNVIGEKSENLSVRWKRTKATWPVPLPEGIFVSSNILFPFILSYCLLLHTNDIAGLLTEATHCEFWDTLNDFSFLWSYVDGQERWRCSVARLPTISAVVQWA